MSRDEARILISSLIEWYTEDIAERLGLSMGKDTYMDALETLWRGPEGDLISRADAIEAVRVCDVFLAYQVDKIANNIDGFVDSIVEQMRDNIARAVSALPSAEAEQTDCTDFIRWLTETLMDDGMWELNAVAYGEVIARKLTKLGVLEVKDGYYIRPSAEAVQGWIPCSERLPETHTEYVTENPWMQVTVGEDTYQLSDAVLGYGRRKHHSKDDPMVSVVWYEDDGYDRTGWITVPDCEDIDVIAWMPLPEPYKEG